MMPWEIPEDRDEERESVPLLWRIEFRIHALSKRIQDEWPRPIAFHLPARVVYWVLIRALAEVSARIHPDKELDTLSPMEILAYWEKKSRDK